MVYVVVDPQNDFITGPLGSPAAKETADRIAAFIKTLDEDDILILTKDWHSKEDKELQKFGNHCIANTEGAEVYQPIKEAYKSFEGGKGIFHKNTFGTNVLMDADKITFMGFCTDICVLVNTVIYQQKHPDSIINVAMNFCCGTSKEAEESALLIMKGLGVNII